MISFKDFIVESHNIDPNKLPPKTKSMIDKIVGHAQKNDMSLSQLDSVSGNKIVATITTHDNSITSALKSLISKLRGKADVNKSSMTITIPIPSDELKQVKAL